MLILCLALGSFPYAQIRPLPTRITVIPVVKKKYKNLVFNVRIYEAPGKLRNALDFMVDPNVAYEKPWPSLFCSTATKNRDS